MTEHATDPDEITARLRLWEHVAATNHGSRHQTHFDAAEVARDARLEIDRLRVENAKLSRSVVQ